MEKTVLTLVEDLYWPDLNCSAPPENEVRPNMEAAAEPPRCTEGKVKNKRRRSPMAVNRRPSGHGTSATSAAVNRKPPVVKYVSTDQD